MSAVRSREAVRRLGELMGFGAMMHLAEEVWRARLVEQGYPPGGEFAVGPCAAMMVECPCPDKERDRNGHCEVCCGSKRITKRVASMLEERR